MIIYACKIEEMECTWNSESDILLTENRIYHYKAWYVFLQSIKMSKNQYKS